MKKVFAIFGLCLLLVCWPGSGVLAQIVTEQSNVTFSVSHVSGQVEGTITGMQGTVHFNEQNPAESSMDATLEAKTVNTENRARDSDLRKEKFFDVEKYPQISFRSKNITKTENGYEVSGSLTIKNHTREVVIPFQREQKGAKTIYTGSFTLNRKDYELGNGTFPPIGKTVKVHILAVVR